ncbi:MAG: hypothetical protein Q9169_003932 [Polycauliona sp. 2 TL-2023]
MSLVDVRSGAANGAPPRPTSRNPFLDQPPQTISNSPPSNMSTTQANNTDTNPTHTGNTADLFDNLTLTEKLGANGPLNQTALSSSTHRPLRPENVPPAVQQRPAPPAHRPSRSEEEQRRLRTGAKPRDASDATPTLQSLAGQWGRKKTEEGEKDDRGREMAEKLERMVNPSNKVFHHDGPFDACNPHRNRKGAKVAPMQAFAKDSINNTLGGSGPVNKNLDLNQFHGRGAEGFSDFSTSRANNPAGEPEPFASTNAPIRRGPGIRPGVDRATSYNPTDRVQPLHGDESLGLGTSTFLDGAPAARAAMVRRESESEGGNGAGGLGRKRSLAQKIRGISNASRNYDRPAGRVTSPDAPYERTTSPTSPREVQSGGGMRNIRETKPFFDDYDEAYEKKGQKIQIAEEQNRVEGGGSRTRAISSPKRAPPPGGLERRITHDGTGGQSADQETKKEGFLSRVKSLKGGKRARPERREY